MTWSEFKQKAEAAGISDEDKVEWVDCWPRSDETKQIEVLAQPVAGPWAGDKPLGMVRVRYSKSA